MENIVGLKMLEPINNLKKNIVYLLWRIFCVILYIRPINEFH